MNNQGKNPPLEKNGDIGSDASASTGDIYASGYFPKEFERRWSDLIDKRYYTILLITFVVNFSIVFYYSLNPPVINVEAESARIQQQYARLVLDKTEPLEEPAEKTEALPVEELKSDKTVAGSGGEGSGSGSGSGDEKAEQAAETRVGTVESRRADYSSETEKRRTSREQISREVSSKGLLGLLTSDGGTATGEGVADVLGDAGSGSQKNLDEVLGNLDGLKTTGQSTSGSGGSGTGSGSGDRSQRGGRAAGGGGIDDLISGKEEAKSAQISRKGNIVVEKVSSIADEKGIKSESRDADKVSEVINAHNAAIQYCYQRELKQNPDLKGKLVVRFTIMPNGKTTNVKIVSSTLNNSRVERCIISRIERWDDFGVIDASKGDATFRQVYTFGY